MRVKHSLKRLTSLLLCLVMLAQTVVVASAAGFSPASATPEPSPAADFTVNAAGAITGYSGNDDNIVIPKAINGVTIKSINAYAFDDSMAANIVIPSTVTYVGSLPDSSYLEGIYFYGDCPNGLDSVLEYTYYVEDTTIYCKQAYRSSFEGIYGLNGDWEEEEFIPTASIAADLADPAYPEAPSHSWVYTDNGDGTHSAACTDEGCTEVITNETHTYTDGVCVCGAKADGSKPEMFNYKVLDETAKTAAIIGYTGLGGEITLPSTYTKDGVTYTVTTVAADAFCGNGNNYSNTDAEALSKITKITVPASITTVEARGFNYVGRYQTRAWNLKEIVFEAESVTFGASALGSNTSLTSVTLPAKQAEIASSMFSGDTALTTLTIPSSVTSIGEKAFSGCTALSEVTFKSATPPTMAVTTSYPSGTYPFGGLTQAVTLYVPTDYVEAYNTAWADMLKAGVTKAGNITVVGKGDADDEPVVASIPDFKVYVNGSDTQYMEYRVVSFDNKTKTGTVELKYVGWNKDGGTLEIPSEVTTQVLGKDWKFTVVGIGENAMFSYQMTGASSNYWFTTVNFPATLEYIAKGGCWSLEKVTEIDLSNTKVHTLGTYAFYGCNAVQTVKLPAALKQMGTETSTITIGDGDAKEELTYTENVFACCDALVNIFVDESNPNFKDVNGVLYTKDGKKLIRYPNAKPAAHFDIPEGVEVIASQAFMQSYRGSSVLSTVSFPSTLKSIESLAFRQSALTEVTVPAGVTFGTSVFDICKKLAKVTIEDGVEALGDYMFWSDEALTEIAFPASLKKVGDSCFGHTGLVKADLGKVEELGSYAFYITHLTEVTIPATAETIGTAVFADIDELTKVTFEEGAKTIGRFMFSSDYALSDLTLADSITSIGEYAFSYCVSLESVTMPKSLSEMGDAVFYKAWKSLYKVVFPDEVTINALPASTFESCQALTYVYLGKNITATGPVSLYDTNAALKVDCAVQKDSFTRNAFDVYPYDLTDTALFKAYKVGSTDADGNVLYYLVQLTEAGVSGGCGGSGATDENAWYPIYPGATPTFTFGSAVPAEAVVLTLYVKQPGEDTAEVKTYTMSQLKALATKGVIGYQHWKNGEEKLVAATEYVTLAALLADAELTFGSCDSITATADDGFASTMTHADSVTGKYYIDSEGEKTEVPAALLLTWNTGAGTLEDVADTAYFSGNLRFGYGISEDQYGTAKGNRIANKVVSLTVNVKAAHENVVTDPAVEPTEDAAGKTEGEHCEACGTVIKAQEDIPATNPVVLTVKGLDKDGKAVEKMYRVNDLKALAKTGKAGYQYWKGGNEQMVAATEYVTIDDLLANAGIDFDKGDSVKATAADGFSGTLTYADKNTLRYYIDSEGEKTEVPAILALKWNSGTGTLDEVAAAAKDTGNIRFCYGIGADQYGSAAGKRLVSNIAAVEVTYCQHTNLEPSVKENENSATCTKDGSYDEVVYCSDCGEEVSRETKTIKAPGHSWDDGVITTKPTTRKEGVKTFTCTECGATKTKAVPKLDKPTNPGSGYDPGVYKDLMDGKDGKTTDVKSQNTGDAGIALYVGLSLLSLTGGAWAVKKNRKVR